MNKEKYMKNGVFSLEYDKETLKDMVLELQKQLEAYENMRKEAIKLIEEKQKLGALNYVDINDLLNILNKVGDCDV